MPQRILKTINLERYFLLMSRLLPAASGFAVCDDHGRLIAINTNTCGFRMGEHIQFNAFASSNESSLFDNIYLLAFDDERTMVKIDVHINSGKVVASLLAIVGKDTLDRKNVDKTVIVETLRTISSCIAKEYELTAELDEMADELAVRYEELNLVYEDIDDVAGYEHEAGAFNQLLDNCIEHLDVAVAALVFPDKNSTSYATRNRDSIEDPFNLIQQLTKPLNTWIQENRESVIINGPDDALRSQLCQDIPYKVMAFPVTGSQGTITGMLVCLNHMYSKDYYNSDRNLLELMSRKITKIIQVKYDALTGLMNLRTFQPVLEKAIDSANKKGITHSFLNVDLDQLKVINDSMGREAGDAAIRFVADILGKKLRTTDTVSYHGEGRFGVLLEKCQADKALRVAENVRKTVSETGFSRDSKPVDVSVSIGMALIEPYVKNADTILEAAEIARESAKEGGRNRIQVYRHDDKGLAARKEHMLWANRIQKALREDRFELYAQTIEPLTDTNENYHFEVLLRMIGKDSAVILPGQFIPPAERFNLMPTIDRWVIDKTFATLSEHGFARSPLEGVVSINLAGQSLSDEGLIDYISQKFTEYDLATNCICFEVTETSAIGDMESAHYIMSYLKDKGCRFSLDDFGTGLSSFSYLKYLPVEYVKIDGSFVKQMLDDQVAHAMVSSINQIGHVMGLKTIAEFVENDELRKQLELISIDYIQGYSVCKPVPLDEYLAVLLRGDTVMTG